MIRDRQHAWKVFATLPDAVQRVPPIVDLVRSALAICPDQLEFMRERMRSDMEDAHPDRSAKQIGDVVDATLFLATENLS